MASSSSTVAAINDPHPQRRLLLWCHGVVTMLLFFAGVLILLFAAGVSERLSAIMMSVLIPRSATTTVSTARRLTTNNSLLRRSSGVRLGGSGPTKARPHVASQHDQLEQRPSVSASVLEDGEEVVREGSSAKRTMTKPLSTTSWRQLRNKRLRHKHHIFRSDNSSSVSISSPVAPSEVLAANASFLEDTIPSADSGSGSPASTGNFSAAELNGATTAADATSNTSATHVVLICLPGTSNENSSSIDWGYENVELLGEVVNGTAHSYYDGDEQMLNAHESNDSDQEGGLDEQNKEGPCSNSTNANATMSAISTEAVAASSSSSATAFAIESVANANATAKEDADRAAPPVSNESATHMIDAQAPPPSSEPSISTSRATTSENHPLTLEEEYDYDDDVFVEHYHDVENVSVSVKYVHVNCTSAAAGSLGNLLNSAADGASGTGNATPAAAAMSSTAIGGEDDNGAASTSPAPSSLAPTAASSEMPATTTTTTETTNTTNEEEEISSSSTMIELGQPSSAPSMATTVQPSIFPAHAAETMMEMPSSSSSPQFQGMMGSSSPSPSAPPSRMPSMNPSYSPSSVPWGTAVPSSSVPHFADTSVPSMWPSSSFSGDAPPSPPPPPSSSSSAPTSSLPSPQPSTSAMSQAPTTSDPGSVDDATTTGAPSSWTAAAIDASTVNENDRNATASVASDDEASNDAHPTDQQHQHDDLDHSNDDDSDPQDDDQSSPGCQAIQRNAILRTDRALDVSFWYELILRSEATTTAEVEQVERAVEEVEDALQRAVAPVLVGCDDGAGEESGGRTRRAARRRQLQVIYGVESGRDDVILFDGPCPWQPSSSDGENDNDDHFCTLVHGRVRLFLRDDQDDSPPHRTDAQDRALRAIEEAFAAFAGERLDQDETGWEGAPPFRAVYLGGRDPLVGGPAPPSHVAADATTTENEVHSIHAGSNHNDRDSNRGNNLPIVLFFSAIAAIVVVFASAFVQKRRSSSVAKRLRNAYVLHRDDGDDNHDLESSTPDSEDGCGTTAVDVSSPRKKPRTPDPKEGCDATGVVASIQRKKSRKLVCVVGDDDDDESIDSSLLGGLERKLSGRRQGGGSEKRTTYDIFGSLGFSRSRLETTCSDLGEALPPEPDDHECTGVFCLSCGNGRTGPTFIVGTTDPFEFETFVAPTSQQEGNVFSPSGGTMVDPPLDERAYVTKDTVLL